MSEYQYYEFQTLDRRLTEQEIAQIRKLSSRVQITPTSASFVYNYGDFRGDPHQLMAKHFQAMLYMTNWSTRQVMFSFPKKLISANQFAPYLVPYHIQVIERDDVIILDLDLSEEESEGMWVDSGEGQLPHFASLRDDILQGDFRTLYLAWLRSVELNDYIYENPDEFDEAEAEDKRVPVPPNLGQLTPALQRFMDFIELSRDMVAVAAIHSANITPTALDLKQAISALTEEERMNFLVQVAEGSANVRAQLLKRLREVSPQPASAATSQPPSATELLAAAKGYFTSRVAQEKAAAAKAHTARMETLVSQEDGLWYRATNLIEERKTKSYDEAIKLLIDLRDLADYQQKRPAFNQRMADLKKNYKTLNGFLSRLKDAKL